MTAHPQQAVATAPMPTPIVRKYKPDLLMYVTTAFVWVSVWRFQDLWPILATIKLPMALEFVLLALVATQASLVRSWKWPKSKLFAIPFLLLVIMVVGLPTNLWRGHALTFITKDFSPSLLLMSALAMGLRDHDDLDWMAFAYLIGAAVYAEWINRYFQISSDGRLGGLVFYDANDFAVLLVCALPFAIYFARPGVSVGKRVFAIGALGVFVEMLIKSGSRGGFLGLMAVTLFVVLRFRAIPKRIRFGALAAGIVLMSVLASATYWTMMRSILHPDKDYNTTAETGRKAVWKRGVGYMLANPVLGVGAAAFPIAEGTLSETAAQYAEEGRGLKWSTAHNSFVLAGAELGVGGLMLFIAMLGLSFSQLSKVRPPPDGLSIITASDEAFAQALMGSIVGYCVAAFFVSGTYYAYLYFLIGLVVAQLAVLRRRAAAPRPVGTIGGARVPAGRPRHMRRPTWTPAA